MIKFSQLPEIVQGQLLQLKDDHIINYIITDSRKLISHPGTLFFANQGPNHDGHLFLGKLYNAGLRNFVVEKEIDTSKFKDANFVWVKSSLDALQALIRHHREQLPLEVIAITGSNGKTIVKEWLLQLLSSRYRVIATPHSYNSQLGVPLSVWQANESHELGIFEAGISKPGEMEKLERVIKPDLGIITNIGSAHDEGFRDRHEKLQEKLKLFKGSKSLIWCGDHTLIREEIYKNGYSFHSYTWGLGMGNNIIVVSKEFVKDGVNLILREGNDESTLHCQVSDDASLENLLHCVAMMRFLEYSWEDIASKIKRVRNIPMRLELKKGLNDCYIIDDSYNNDLAGLEIALNFLAQQKQRTKKTVILSDIFQSGMNEKELYEEVNKLLVQKGISRIFAIGPQISKWKSLFTIPVSSYTGTGDFLKKVKADEFINEMILVKGARVYAFERIVNNLLEKIHGTRLEINLGAITHNLNFYRSRIAKDTKLMVMVKAFAYGTGMYEIANLLQYLNVNYLGVAYIDEGVNLRNNGIKLPIMIMNPSSEGYSQVLKYHLEPEVYSFSQLFSLLDFLKGRKLKIHLKLDTGMHRLGFQGADIERLITILKEANHLQVKSIFTHLAAADDKGHERFTIGQAEEFDRLYNQISVALSINPLRHVLNSAGIINYPQYQYDMIRLGVGLYGIEASGLLQDKLQPISTLKTIISQVREVKKGNTIGYGRIGKAGEDKKIATIAIGYADGFSRAFSDGKGEVAINGKRASVIGNVCMDMSMIDVTGIDADEGDDVIVFGENPTINELAQKIGTIPYEILTNVSERVKRIYLYD